jgi:hypothetical protein
MNATEVISRALMVYTECNSYQDNGIVEFPGPDDTKQHLHFKTFFAKGGRFCFEWNNSLQTGEISYDGEKSLLRSHDQREQEKDLSSSLACAAGITVGATLKIPALLIDIEQINNQHFLDLEGIGITESTSQNGTACYQLSGKGMNGNLYEIWIAKEKFVILKIREKYIQSIEEAIRLDGIINEYRMASGLSPLSDIPDKEIRFFCDYVYTSVQLDELIVS